jgi:hypothetical protein
MILRKEGENRRHGRRPYTKALRSGGGVRGWWRGEKPRPLSLVAWLELYGAGMVWFEFQIMVNGSWKPKEIGLNYGGGADGVLGWPAGRKHLTCKIQIRVAKVNKNKTLRHKRNKNKIVKINNKKLK